MSKTTKFDVVILGSGVAGISAAVIAADHHLSVCLIDKEENLGGISYNYGMVPSKTLLQTVQTLDTITQAESFGIKGIPSEKIRPDWGLITTKIKDNVKRSVKQVSNLLKKKNITRINGIAKVNSKNSIMVNHESISFDSLIVATGSHYNIPEIFSLDQNKILTPKTIYSIKEIPSSITIIGAGIIGIEFAFMFAGLGSNVHLVEKSNQIMPYMDDDLNNFLINMLKEKNINLHLGYETQDFKSDKLFIKNKQQSDVIKTELYLSCIGRKANLDGLEFLIQNNMELTKQGFIATNLKCQTTLPNIYAVGDVNGRYMLAHVANKEGEIASFNIAGKTKEIIYDIMPYNMYTSPEFASVGLTEKKAKEQGFLTRTQIYPFSSNLKAVTQGRAEGFVKIVTNDEKSEILGIHIVGHNATDIIGEAILYMISGGLLEDFKNIVHPHPSLNEALVESLK